MRNASEAFGSMTQTTNYHMSSIAASEIARNARILVTITVHFNPARVAFLAEVLRSLSEFATAAMDITLVTNTFHDDELSLLRRLCDEIFSNKSASIRSYGDLMHPFDLAWCHKTIISEEFSESKSGRYTHFIYLEDDMRMSFLNFCYFVEFREVLRGFQLLPSFLRVEYSSKLNGFVSSDNAHRMHIANQPRIEMGNIVLTTIYNPYCGCFILDVELISEYIHTRSFKKEDSKQVIHWGIRERAAMGLCFENVPENYKNRYLAAVSRQTSNPEVYCWISHLPNNYADDPDTPFGKLRMDSLFSV